MCAGIHIGYIAVQHLMMLAHKPPFDNFIILLLSCLLKKVENEETLEWRVSVLKCLRIGCYLWRCVSLRVPLQAQMALRALVALIGSQFRRVKATDR